jgi:hypothetical protein
MKKLLYAIAILVCISFFSVRDAGKCSSPLCYKKPGKTNTYKEENLSPVYNFLSI